MKSKASFSKLSSAIIKEDFRRFWILPVLAFLDYFLCSVFYIIMNLKDLPADMKEAYDASEYLASYINNFLSGSNPTSISIMVWVPVLSVILVFRYLHNSGHTVSVHSQPFTRQTLLNSHAVSCMLFMLIPILLTGLIMLIIAQPAYISEYNDEGVKTMVNVFTRTNVLRWMWESLLTSMFVMMVAICSGMITGTVFHHAVAALGFNAVLPMCTAILTLYGDTYLFGYVAPEWLSQLCIHMSPVLNVLEGGYLSGLENVLYIVLTLLLFAGASFLYRKRRLERATEGIVFHAFNVLITLIFGYLGMTGFGLVFYGLFDNSHAAAAFGYIMGGLLGMLVVRMIIMKTVKVFNKKTLIIIGSYTCAALVFFAILVFDLMGYETKICKDADTITIDCELVCDTYESQEVKDLITEIHQMIIDNKDLCIENNRSTDNYEESSYVYIIYYKGNGNDENSKILERRSYSVPTYLLFRSPEFRALLECDEVKDKLVEAIPESSLLKYIQVYSGSYYNFSAHGQEDSFEIFEDDILVNGLISAIKQDLRERTADDFIRSYNIPAIAEIDFHYAPGKPASNTTSIITCVTEDDVTLKYGNEEKSEIIADQIENNEIDYAYEIVDDPGYSEFYINASFKNTLQWLRDNGFGHLIDYNPAYYKAAVLCDLTDGMTSEELPYEFNIETGLDAGSEFTVVTDPAVIQNLYEHAVSHVSFGRQSEITSSESGVCKVVFFTGNDSTLTDDYEAFVEKKYALAIGQ